MDCREFQQYIYLYLDGEFGEKESLGMEEHMRACIACRRQVSSELQFLRVVKESLSGEQMPQKRKLRVEGAARAALHPAMEMSTFWRIGIMVPGAAAAALLLFVVLKGYQSGEPSDELFIRESLAAHESSLPSEVEGNEEQIVSYLRDRAGFLPSVPLRHDDLRLVGARVDRVGSIPAVVYRYDYTGRPVSVVQYDPGGMAVDKIPAWTNSQRDLVKRAGYGVSLFKSGGHLNALVGDLPDKELLKVTPVSYH